MSLFCNVICGLDQSDKRLSQLPDSMKAHCLLVRTRSIPERVADLTQVGSLTKFPKQKVFEKFIILFSGDILKSLMIKKFSNVLLNFSITSFNLLRKNSSLCDFITAVISRSTGNSWLLIFSGDILFHKQDNPTTQVCFCVYEKVCILQLESKHSGNYCLVYFQI